MFLRGSQARFTDPESGEIIPVGSLDHSLSELVMAPIRSGFQLQNLAEFAPDQNFTTQYPRAKKYLDYPMLIVMQLTNPTKELASGHRNRTQRTRRIDIPPPVAFLAHRREHVVGDVGQLLAHPRDHDPVSDHIHRSNRRTAANRAVVSFCQPAFQRSNA